MSIELNGTTGIDFNDGSNQSTAATPYGRKNRIINGDMRIDQRNAGSSVTITTDSTYTLDRWMCEVSQASKFSVQQDAAAVTPPVGFNDYLGVTSLSSYSVGTSDYFTVMQRIEGYNVADLDFGKATAKTITISFWVRSSLTGTFGGSIGNSAENRSYPFNYTINSANTWEQKTITIAGDTTGTWLTTNGRGLNVRFSLGMGSTFTDTANAWTTKANVYSATGATSVVGTSGATFYITGVQLEVGDAASDFEFMPYDMELARCQRYYLRYSNNASGQLTINNVTCFTTTQTYSAFRFPVEMRSGPSLDISAAGDFYVTARGANFACTSVTGASATNFSIQIGTVNSGLTVGDAAWFRFASSVPDLTDYIEFDAEL